MCSSDLCEQTHPRQAPFFALGYAVRRYLWDPWPCQGVPPADLQVPSGDWHQDVRDLVRSGILNPSKLTFVLYPTEQELVSTDGGRGWMNVRQAELIEALGVPVPVVRVSDDPRWRRSLYQDPIHPSDSGIEVLATIVAAHLPAEVSR